MIRFSCRTKLIEGEDETRRFQKENVCEFYTQVGQNDIVYGPKMDCKPDKNRWIYGCQ